MTESKKTVRIVNKLGLHIRPSRQVAALAQTFDAEITIRNHDRSAGADSQLDLLMLLASEGADLEICAEGPQADEAVEALADLIAEGFGELKN
ncbi:MAG: HPr family phosphocarrier protein [Pseudomonadota bacterium]